MQRNRPVDAMLYPFNYLEKVNSALKSNSNNERLDFIFTLKMAQLLTSLGIHTLTLKSPSASMETSNTSGSSSSTMPPNFPVFLDLLLSLSGTPSYSVVECTSQFWSLFVDCPFYQSLVPLLPLPLTILILISLK